MGGLVATQWLPFVVGHEIWPHIFLRLQTGGVVVRVVDKDHMDSRGRQRTSRSTSTVRTFDSARVTHLDGWHLRSQCSLRPPFPLQRTLTKSRASLHNRLLFSSYLSPLTSSRFRSETKTHRDTHPSRLQLKVTPLCPLRHMCTE